MVVPPPCQSAEDQSLCIGLEETKLYGSNIITHENLTKNHSSALLITINQMLITNTRAKLAGIGAGCRSLHLTVNTVKRFKILHNSMKQ